MQALALPWFGHRLRAMALALTVMAATSSHAGYTVIEDDLFPNSVLSERNAALVGRPSFEPDVYQIPFARRQGNLGPAGRSLVAALLPVLRQAATVRIVGRPDGVANDTLALNRAKSLRSYLERLGVNRERIRIETENSPNQLVNGGNYPVELYVQKEVPLPSAYAQDFVAPQPRSTSHSIAQEYEIQQKRRAEVSVSVPQAMPAPHPSRTSSQDAAVIQYINTAVLNGQMQPAVAIELLRTLAAGGQSSSQQGVPAPSLPAVPSMPAQPLGWTLDKRLNLQDNLESWVRQAGWNPIVWSPNARDLSHAFQITNSVTVAGEFPEVLRRVAEVTGLNICAIPRQRLVRITESSLACNP